MNLLSGKDEDRYILIDDSGRNAGNLKSSFHPGLRQVKFLIDAGANAINYNKKTGIFFIKFNSFRAANRTVWLHVNFDNRNIAPAFDTIFLRDDNRYYILKQN